MNSNQTSISSFCDINEMHYMILREVTHKKIYKNQKIQTK